MDEKGKDNNPGHEKPDYTEGVKRQLHLWVFMMLLFFFSSLALAYGTYYVISLPGSSLMNPLGSISAYFGQHAENTHLPPDNRVPRHIDGVLVEPGAENIYPVGVMIDNHSDAWPQAGLAHANLVIEAEAEGGITRYLAFFASSDSPEKIGPIRSARPYFMEWARELSALYTHVGGSPAALAEMNVENVLHINEFYQGEYFWRSDDKLAPHNVYTSSENLYKYLDAKNLNEGKYFGWQFKDEAGTAARPASSTIAIGYRLKGYNVEWRYDNDSNTYSRYVGGDRHLDADGTPIMAKNVIIQVIPAEVIDNELRLEMNTVGTGTAAVCLDGECHNATWQKNSVAERTRFYEDGNEAVFDRGTTWIEVVRPEITLDY